MLTGGVEMEIRDVSVIPRGVVTILVTNSAMLSSRKSSLQVLPLTVGSVFTGQPTHAASEYIEYRSISRSLHFAENVH